MEQRFWDLIATITPSDLVAQAQAQARWDAIAKPLGSLGLLEDAIVRIAGMTGNPTMNLSQKAVVVMCADHGVVAEGVTQTGQEVTAIVTENMSVQRTSVCQMARVANAQVVPVNIGVARPVVGDRIVQKPVRPGTANMAVEPAMTREEAVQALLVGIELVQSLHAQGCTLLATGEMGIGNTTAASALASVLLALPPEEVTGRGAGLSSEGLARKIGVIARAISVNQPRRDDPLDTLHKVGGLDIAGMAGVFLGGAICKIPVLVDGFISSVAALVARRICPQASAYMLASHTSKEPAGERVLQELGLTPFLYAGMRLGEGTGAVAVMPTLDMACAVYQGMTTFSETSIEDYQPLT